MQYLRRVSQRSTAQGCQDSLGIVTELIPRTNRLSVQCLVNFQKPGDGVDPKLIFTVPFQNGISDSPIDLTVQVLCEQLHITNTDNKPINSSVFESKEAKTPRIYTDHEANYTLLR